MGGDEGLVDNHPARVLGSLDQQVGERWNGHVRLVGAVQQVWEIQLVLSRKLENNYMQLRSHWDDLFSLDFIVGHCWQSTTHIFNQLHLQSRCFFFGPIISSVVALHTAFASPWKRFANGNVSISQQIKGKVLTFGRCKYDSIHELDVHLACQTVPGCKNSVVDGLTRCRHPEPTQQLWNTEAVQKRFSTFWWKQRSLFSKEGGPPIIMGPPGLRTAVLPVAGCQYPAQPCPAHAHCRQLHQGACASQP